MADHVGREGPVPNKPDSTPAYIAQSAPANALRQVSMDAALRELQAARAEIARLQRIRDEAQRAADEARAQAASTTTMAPQADPPAYSSKNYWVERYSKGEEVNMAVGSDATYEWYASYSVLRGLLSAALDRCPDQRKSNILLPGCGNSDLGEQLARDYRQATVLGIDFDPSVVQVMHRRAKSLGLRNLSYQEGDLMHLRSHGTSSIGCIVDKGTLDAIASSGEDDNGSGQCHRVIKYCLEMWRILREESQFVVITTMPPPVFETLAIVPIESMCNKAGDAPDDRATDWRNGNIAQAVPTDGGGTVYFYSFKKLKNLVDERELMVSAFVNAVQVAKESGENEAWMEMEREALLMDKADGPAMPRLSERLLTPLQAVSQNADCAAMLPKASLSLVVNGALQADGIIIVDFQFTAQLKEDAATAWQENDVIRLVAVQSEEHLSALLYTSAEPLWESFEYVPTPLISCTNEQHIAKGSVEMRLPNCCGVYVLLYIRAVPPQGDLSTNHYVLIQSSAALNVRSPVHAHHPDARPRPTSVPGRRSAKAAAGDHGPSCQLVVEQMCHIKKIAIGIVWREPQLALSRVNAWVQEPCGAMAQLLLEVDVVQLAADASSVDGVAPYAKEVRTLYFSFAIAESAVAAEERVEQGHAMEIIWSQAFVELAGQSISIRLPYKVHLVPKLPAPLVSLTATSVEFDLCCGFCKQVVLQKASGCELHLLPSGMFDETFHDFLCCENAEHMSLRAEEVLPSGGTLYLGPVFVLASPADVRPSSCVLDCKAGQSLCDLFTSMGSSIAVAPMTLDKNHVKSANGKKKYLKSITRTLKTFVNIDTCSLRCRRCDALLGEATLMGNVAPADRTASAVPADDGASSFSLSEAAQVRFCWNMVSIVSENDLLTLGRSWRWLREATSVEQMVARTCQYLYEKFDATLCCVYPMDDAFVFQQHTDRVEMLLLRVMSHRHFAGQTAMQPGERRGVGGRAELGECVKVTFYLADDAAYWMRGSEARLALPRDDFNKLRGELRASSWMTPGKVLGGSAHTWPWTCLFV